MRLLPLIAATYFMVSGGPYGIEDILGGAGYGWAIAILLVWIAWRIGRLLTPWVIRRFRRPGQKSSNRKDKPPVIIDT